MAILLFHQRLALSANPPLAQGLRKRNPHNQRGAVALAHAPPRRNPLVPHLPTKHVGHLNPAKKISTSGARERLHAANRRSGLSANMKASPSMSSAGDSASVSELDGGDGKDGEEDTEMMDGETGEEDAEGEGDDRKYCTCRSVSYGNMEACDNEECPYEWFHSPFLAPHGELLQPNILRLESVRIQAIPDWWPCCLVDTFIPAQNPRRLIYLECGFRKGVDLSEGYDERLAGD